MWCCCELNAAPSRPHLPHDLGDDRDGLIDAVRLGAESFSPKTNLRVGEVLPRCVHLREPEKRLVGIALAREQLDTAREIFREALGLEAWR